MSISRPLIWLPERVNVRVAATADVSGRGYVGEPLGQRRGRLEAARRAELEDVEGVVPAGEAPVPRGEAESGRVAAQYEPPARFRCHDDLGMFPGRQLHAVRPAGLGE
jgi:hypothetical protein